MRIRTPRGLRSRSLSRRVAAQRRNLPTEKTGIEPAAVLPATVFKTACQTKWPLFQTVRAGFELAAGDKPALAFQASALDQLGYRTKRRVRDSNPRGCYPGALAPRCHEPLGQPPKVLPHDREDELDEELDSRRDAERGAATRRGRTTCMALPL